ncbi:hypothetical protein QQ045_025461 [Rhodiola kirilowii]
MAFQHLTLLSIASLLFILSSQTLAQTTPSAPPPTSSTLPNVTGILDKAGQYTTLIHLLTKNQLTTHLSQQQQVELLLYHVLTKYYALTDFSTVSNPVRTQGKDGLNFTSQGSQLNVSSGIVVTQINNALRQQFPLAVYQVDKVLLPLSLFGAKPPASPPPSPPAPTRSNKTTEADGPSETNSDKNDHSGSGRMNVGAGLVAGLAVLCMGAFS